MTVSCSLCSTPKPHAEAEWNGWKCERCGEVVRACKGCCEGRAMMFVRMELAVRHDVECGVRG